jgi:hypothetical protein
LSDRIPVCRFCWHSDCNAANEAVICVIFELNV